MGASRATSGRGFPCTITRNRDVDSSPVPAAGQRPRTPRRRPGGPGIGGERVSAGRLVLPSRAGTGERTATRGWGNTGHLRSRSGTRAAGLGDDRSVQRSRRSGGSPPVRATRRAFAAPSRARGYSRSGDLRVSAASRPSSTYARRTRATVAGSPRCSGCPSRRAVPTGLTALWWSCRRRTHRSGTQRKGSRGRAVRCGATPDRLTAGGGGDGGQVQPAVPSPPFGVPRIA